MRVSSRKSTRTYCARKGTRASSSRSTASEYVCSCAIIET